MLRYNFTRVFRMKGINKPAPFLMKIGFGKDTAYRIMEHKVKAITPAQVEKLCIHLDCTPNDFMEWCEDD